MWWESRQINLMRETKTWWAFEFVQFNNSKREMINIYSAMWSYVCMGVGQKVFTGQGFITQYDSAVSSTGPPKVMHGAGMKVISSLSLTKCEQEKCLESVLLSKNATLLHNWLHWRDLMTLWGENHVCLFTCSVFESYCIPKCFHSY